MPRMLAPSRPSPRRTLHRTPTWSPCSPWRRWLRRASRPPLRRCPRRPRSQLPTSRRPFRPSWLPTARCPRGCWSRTRWTRTDPATPISPRRELTYFRDLGPRLWIYTQVWFHVRRTISVEVSEWDVSVFAHDLERAEALLESAPERTDHSSMGEVGTVVRSYADSIEAGMSGIDRAVRHLAEARSILEWEEVGPPERSRFIRLSREVEYLLDEFDGAMSAYGCSVCGELFREVGRGVTRPRWPSAPVWEEDSPGGVPPNGHPGGGAGTPSPGPGPLPLSPARRLASGQERRPGSPRLPGAWPGLGGV